MSYQYFLTRDMLQKFPNATFFFVVGGGVIKSEKALSAFEGSLRTVTWYVAPILQ